MRKSLRENSTQKTEYRGHTLEIVCNYRHDEIEARILTQDGKILFESFSFISTMQALRELKRITNEIIG